MLFRKYIPKYSMLLMAAVCILALLSCEKEHDEPSFTNPIDPDNPETHGDPYNVRAQAKDKSIAVQWDATLEADGFAVYRSSSPDGGFEQIGTASTNKYEDADAPPGVTHYYQVRAYRGNEKNQTIPSFLTDRTHAAIKSPPSVKITNTYQEWESGTLEIKAQATDIDGNIQHVQFEYSLNGQIWNEIGTDAESPYMAEWDTNSVVETSDDSVWLKVTATDNDDLTTEKAVDNPFSIDNEAPWVEEWSRTPDDITEDTSGKLRVSALVSDGDGAGMTRNAPQLDYHIGVETTYRGYKAMTMESKNTWRYEIPEPTQGWDTYGGEPIYYRVKLLDVLGNETVSDEQQELIDNIDDPSAVSITSRSASWENGILTIDAEASDVDSSIVSVQFYYSLDRSAWISIATPDSNAPYSVNWDTAEAIPETVNAVWIKAVATDNDGQTAEYILPNSFGVDNQPPVISHDYDGLWNNEDFAIKLQCDDKDGSGVSSISYILNKGSEREHEIGDQGNVSVMISTEGADNTLEYWCVDELGNERKRETLPAIKLDKTKPIFSDWQRAVDLGEDSSGSFRISVRVTDSGGSGLGDEVPQFSYYIGSDDQNDNYEDMVTEDGNVWYYDIPEPSDTWSAHGNEYVYYMAIVQDVAGNSRESLQQTELIDSDNNPPEITSEPITEATEGHLYTYGVEATDPDTDSVLTYSLVTSPEGMEINSSTGEINWTPGSGQTGENDVTVKVSDGNGASETQSFTVSVDKGTIADIGEMVLIPAGEFQMGDSFGEGDSDELPVHTVYLDEFRIDKYEVTNSRGGLLRLDI
ncbi:putative Ig domain-containing protein [Candidatus Poribacteria bacterium]